MKVYLIINGNEALNFDSSAMLPEPFGELLKQTAIIIYSKWLAEQKPRDHKIVVQVD